MKKQNGFTLVELLAVIVILAILIVIAVPNALRMSTNVKEKSYLTKIDNIENVAKIYGENHLTTLKSIQTTASGDKAFYYFKINSNKEIEEVSPTDFTNKDPDYTYESWQTIKLHIVDLVNANNLSYDYKNQCGTLDKNNNKPTECTAFYDNQVTNPVTDYVINYCNVYVYYKYNRVYSFFDRESCDETFNNLISSNEDIKAVDGHQYVAAERLFLNTTKNN